MGFTDFSRETFERYAAMQSTKRILELGNQTIYFGAQWEKPAKLWFQQKGYEHISIDLNGQDGALIFDLCTPLSPEMLALGQFDAATDFGTSEHVANLYECYHSLDQWCRSGGLIFHENPKTGSWPLHGFHFFREAFYWEFAKVTGYELLGCGEHAAMGNFHDGWNIWAVLRKTVAKPFPTKVEWDEQLQPLIAKS